MKKWRRFEIFMFSLQATKCALAFTFPYIYRNANQRHFIIYRTQTMICHRQSQSVVGTDVEWAGLGGHLCHSFHESALLQ